jgi:ribosomal protein L4
MSVRRWLRFLFPRRPAALPAGRPALVRARLELDAVDVDGRAADETAGAVFFATSAPIARGVRGRLRRAGSDERIPVRVTGRRAARPGQPAGLRLAFD